ncbi:hypothetical protein [Lelliottia wanjuensis]|uniref:hypothetical protein n=1 Tax=Lelliottia wanjuensis TaxID=3050585 RepID=UPI00254A5534|nr:hypothetical protein [Lelliottia sp. V86_10]MDK9586716.1 hypothetical protein [Lelliottia sp. V86_10]
MNTDTFKQLVKEMTIAQIDELINFNKPFARKNEEVMGILLKEKECRNEKSY